MERFLIVSLFVVIATCHADYAMPVMAPGLEGISSVLDVEVTEITKEGYARIKVLKTYKSGKKVPTLIKDVDLSCTGGSPKMWGMKEGKRYIVFLCKDNLFEESSFFLIEKKEGKLMCKLGWYRSWFNAKDEWMPLAAFEQKLKKALVAVKPVIERDGGKN